MLEHLDDPVGWTPDREAVVARGRRLRRRRRVLSAGLGTVLSVVAVAAAGVLYVDRRDAAIERVEVATPAPPLDGAVNVLFAGVDQHGGRADTIVVAQVEPGLPLRVLFVPRDLWDPVGQQRMAIAGSSPQSLVDAIDRVLGIPVHHVVTLDMPGFVALVDELGGLELSIQQSMRDRHSGLDLAPAACAVLDGQDALALVRARHLEIRSNELRWAADPTGDLGRMARGAIVASAVVQELAAVGPDPFELDRLSRVLADHAVLDDSLTLDRLMELGRTVAASGAVATDVVPAVPAVHGAAVVLDLAPDADAVLEPFRGGAPSPTAPDVEQPALPQPIATCPGT